MRVPDRGSVMSRSDGSRATSASGRVQSQEYLTRQADVPRRATGLSLACAAILLGGCAGSSNWDTQIAYAPEPKFPESTWGVKASERVASHTAPVPKGGGVYKVGQPYKVGDKWYKPREQPGYDRIGIASWYGSDFHARKTANGEVYDMNALTAAHPTLPMPSYAYVTNLDNNRTVLVRINDRGPYVKDRLIDLSKAAADALALKTGGTGRVRVRYAGSAPLNGDDSRERQFLASGQGNGPRVPYALSAEAPRVPPQQPSSWSAQVAPVQQASAWAPAPSSLPGPTYSDPIPPPGGWGAGAPVSDPNDAWSPSAYRAGLATNR